MGKVRRTSPGLDALRNAASQLDGLKTRVGFFESAKYADGTPVAAVAVVQEHGSAKNGIPARSFMRTTIAEQSTEWSRQMERGAAAVARGAIDGRGVMDAIGALAAGDVRRKIADIADPPLAESTVEKRRRRYANGGEPANSGISKPLVDSGVLINSVTHETGDRSE